jgi:hypothetical protein
MGTPSAQTLDDGGVRKLFQELDEELLAHGPKKSRVCLGLRVGMVWNEQGV